VIEWLNSPEGYSWAYNRFDDATECHDLIEVTEESDTFSDATWSNPARIWNLHNHNWPGLEWTPDQPPEGGRRELSRVRKQEN
jgi:hypothetical protein